MDTFTPRLSYSPGKERAVLIEYMTGEPQSRSARGGEEEYHIFCLEFHPGRLVTLLNEPSRLFKLIKVGITIVY
jgi:hypothetical protein